MGPIVVIADDFSGAAELAGIARARGLSAEVERGEPAAPAATVVAIDTDTRGLSADAAAERLRHVTRQIARLQPAWLYQKVDSVLRGNVRTEIEAVLGATGLARAMLVPCNPSRGRCIVAGRYLVDGVPLDRTALASDPDHPRTTADVALLLGSGGRVPVRCVARHAACAEQGIVVPDVGNESDLHQRAVEVGPHTLAVGAADFFRTLLAERGPVLPLGDRPAERDGCDASLWFSPPLLLVCGSKASWPMRQQECRRAGFVVATIDQPQALLQPHAAALLGFGDALVADRQVAQSRLEELVAAYLARWHPSAILAEGGATAAAIARRLAWSRFDVAAAAPDGVGILRPRGLAAPLLVIKPGSYSWPAALWDAVLRAKGAAPSADRSGK